MSSSASSQTSSRAGSSNQTLSVLRLFRLRELLGSGIGNLGKLPINTRVEAFYDAVTPDDAADWQLRFQVQFLFPE